MQTWIKLLTLGARLVGAPAAAAQEPPSGMVDVAVRESRVPGSGREGVARAVDAPVYLAAAQYPSPAILPYVLAVRLVPFGELKANPQAWAIVLKHMPMAKRLASQPDWLLGTMTLADFALFAGGLDPKVESAIDAELARLPAVSPRS